uniref:Uncharacterized protein n=1 Tax=Anguilla anguilla TaxID=7936 RepID=A0A0E9SLQ3_ANGAN
MLLSQHGSKSLRNVSSTLLNPCCRGFRMFWRKKAVLPCT